MIALPPLLLAAMGLTHPQDLTDDTAGHWRTLHVLLLPVFPLLALAPWLVTRPVSRVLGWLVALLGYVFATLYTALDVLAGIGAGALQADNGGSGRLVLFAQGADLADYGEWAYVLATVLAAAVAVRTVGLAAVPVRYSRCSGRGCSSTTTSTARGRPGHARTRTGVGCVGVGDRREAATRRHRATVPGAGHGDRTVGISVDQRRNHR